MKEADKKAIKSHILNRWGMHLDSFLDDYEKEIIQYGSGEDIEDMVNAYISDSDLNYHLNDELEEALVIVTNFEHIAFVDTNRL